jgi:hypothetical protein
MSSPIRLLLSSSPMLGGRISRPAFKRLVPHAACSKVIFPLINAAVAMLYCGTPSSESPQVARDRSATNYLAEPHRLSIGWLCKRRYRKQSNRRPLPTRQLNSLTSPMDWTVTRVRRQFFQRPIPLIQTWLPYSFGSTVRRSRRQHINLRSRGPLR